MVRLWCFSFSHQLCNLIGGKSVGKEGKLVGIESLYYGTKKLIVFDNN
jgi:hypothetical protein